MSEYTAEIDEVTGQNRPVVPPLVRPEPADQVRSVKREARPSLRLRVERGAVGGAEVDGFGQLVLMRRHRCVYRVIDRGRRGPEYACRSSFLDRLTLLVDDENGRRRDAAEKGALVVGGSLRPTGCRDGSEARRWCDDVLGEERWT